MMERTSQIFHNKKGVSLTELIAYIVLYGVVMSLLASLVFVIINSARKVNSQAILNRGASIMYTEILARTVALNPDTVSKVTYKIGNQEYTTLPDGTNKTTIDSISITFSKINDYNDDGKKITLPAANQKHLTFTYNKGEDNIKVYSKEGTGNPVESSINLEYDMRISSSASDNPTDDSIYRVISCDIQNDASVYVTFNGYLKFDNKKTEFNFIIPVFATV